MKPLPKSSSTLLFQYGNEELRRENDILQKLLNCLKKRLAVSSNTATILTDLVAMQRKHIESLEEQYESTQTAYENALKGHVSSYQLQTDLEAAKGKCELLQETISELNARMGKEISELKKQYIEQNARLVLGKDINFQAKTPHVHYSGKLPTDLSPIKKSNGFAEYKKYEY
eukprot:TRINITY_DN7847_c0_g1_i2.p1 TRINITY_DN7847_c0_g1~~TRINITY_DN7847_c0_g1_i2.p1  ORF type:complete len:172 (+),score=25.23 TRINITY_DN7847_c0_g1_i2:72-587(+)